MTTARIIVVEDEMLVARDICLQLQELGYEPVATCRSGEEAIAAAQSKQPDLILMDIHLDGAMDGIQATEKIHETQDIPVVFLTAFAEETTFARAKATGPYGYITKPFDEHELGRVIDLALFKHRTETQVRENEERLRAITESARDAIVMMDETGKATFWNPAATVIFGYTREEMLGQDVHAILAGEADQARYRAAHPHFLQTGQGGAVGTIRELRTRHKDGRMIDISLSLSAVMQGGARHAVSLIRDITEQKKVERRLRLQAAAMDAAMNTIVITNEHGEIEWANPAFTRVSGYTLEEALGQNPRILKSGEQSEEFYRELWQTISSGQNWSGTFVNRHKEGHLYTEEVTIAPVKSEAGGINHYIAIKQDITRRRAAEKSLQESEERYRLLFDASPVPMWLYDTDTLRFLAVNDTALRQYGYSNEEFLGSTLLRVQIEADVAAFQQWIATNREVPLTMSEAKHRRKDGTEIAVELLSRPMRYQGHEARLVIAIDVSEKKALEQQYLRAQRLESLGQLASGIAHDLNNMLAPVLFAAPLLRGRLTSESDGKVLDALENSAQRGADLVRQILGFARGASAGRRVVQLKHITREVAATLESTLPKTIRLVTNIQTTAWPVEADPTQIHQLILNLAVNARDAMPEGGLLTINLANRTLTAEEAETIPGASSGHWVEIAVSDTGTGIPPDVLPHIWDAFYTTKPAGSGTGLGLATVRGILVRHHGFVQVETKVRKGSTFRIFLPASARAADNDGTQEVLPAHDQHADYILVVDDDSILRDIMATALSTQGYRAITCADGVEAIVKFNDHAREIALVVTDLDMPGLNGAVLAATLRKLQPALPIIGMTGFARGVGLETAFDELKAMADAWLEKPFSVSTFLNTVDQVVRARNSGASNPPMP
jgi:two-component system, cell cycle sensor histidine kinase and response regulator CckA